MKVVFSDRAFAGILAETTEKVRTETGGLFLGVVEGDNWYIIEAIDPGPKSIFEVAYFEYDQQYTQHLINKVANLYSTRLDLVGLWHRHPGSFDKFSSTDDGTNSKYAHMRPQGAISALVNIDPEFRLTVYHVNQPCIYTKISYSVGNNLIPDQFLSYKSDEEYYELMTKLLSNTKGRGNSVSLKTLMEEPLKKLEPVSELMLDSLDSSDEATEKILDAIVEDAAYISGKGITFVVIKESGKVCLVNKNNSESEKLCFAYDSKNSKVALSYKNNWYYYRPGVISGIDVVDDEPKSLAGNCAEGAITIITDFVKKISDSWR